MKACFIQRYNFKTQVLPFEFFLKSSRNNRTFSGSFFMCFDRGVILEKSNLCSSRCTCLLEYFLLAVPSIMSENCLVSMEQYCSLASLTFLVKSTLSFARAFLVNGVGLPLRCRFLTLPVFLNLAINRLTDDCSHPIKAAICCCVFPSCFHLRTSSRVCRFIMHQTKHNNYIKYALFLSHTIISQYLYSCRVT